MFQQSYANANKQQTGDYSNLMSKFSNFTPNADATAGYKSLMTGTSSARPFAQDFATTGGFSPTDIAAIRARSTSPARAMYGNAMDDLTRTATMTGASALPALKARMARDLSSNLGDLSASTEANIAGMKQQGKLAGMQGLSQADQIEAAMHEAGLAGLSDQDKMALQAAMGGSSLYSATPGLVSTFGNQVLQNSGQGIQAGQLQNETTNSYLENLINKNRIPSDFSQALGRIGQIGGLVSGIPGIVKGFQGH